MTPSLFGTPSGEPEVLVIKGRLVSESPILDPTWTLADCETCCRNILIGPDHRRIVTEFQARGLVYHVRCPEHVRTGFPDLDDATTLNAGLEADRLALLRGVAPRGPLVVVTREEIAAARAANPDLIIVPLFPL